MARLTSLDLGDNDIGDAGVASLAPSLALMAQLTSLHLENNDICSAVAAWLPARSLPLLSLCNLW
jgi:Leucine-rich repeat (LRR) protein